MEGEVIKMNCGGRPKEFLLSEKIREVNTQKCCGNCGEENKCFTLKEEAICTGLYEAICTEYFCKEKHKCKKKKRFYRAHDMCQKFLIKVMDLEAEKGLHYFNHGLCQDMA